MAEAVARKGQGVDAREDFRTVGDGADLGGEDIEHLGAGAGRCGEAAVLQ
ncbi:hypothetical protein [Nocardia sp. NPDC047648]